MSIESRKKEREAKHAKRHARKVRVHALVCAGVEAEQRVATVQAAAVRTMSELEGLKVRCARLEDQVIFLTDARNQLLYAFDAQKVVLEIKRNEVMALKIELNSLKAEQALLTANLRSTTDALDQFRMADCDAQSLRRRLQERSDKIKDLQTEICKLRTLVPPRPLLFDATQSKPGGVM